MAGPKSGGGGGFNVGAVDQTGPADGHAPALSPAVTPMLNDWLRPSLIVGKVFYQLSIVGFLGPETRPLCGMNPNRVAVFFGHSLNTPNVLTAGLSRDGIMHPIVWVQAQDTQGGTLSDLLSVVCGEWIGTMPAAGTVYVTELIRRS